MKRTRHTQDLSRRDFLKCTLLGGAGLAVPLILPGRVLGLDGAVAPSERIVFAGIGLGPRGQYDLSVMLPEKDVQFVAICDVQRSRRAEVKRMADNHYGNKDCAMYRDFRELLARRDIDTVLIAAGDHWHALGSLLAAKAGKDIYSEKPCGLTIAEIQALADGVHRYGRVYQAGTQRRSRGRNAIGTFGSDRLPGGPTTAIMCREAGADTTTSRRRATSRTGAPTRWTFASGPTRATTPCRLNTKPRPIRSSPAMRMA